VTTAAKKSPADPKKVWILTALLVIAAIALYMNVFSGGTDAPVAVRPGAPGAGQPAPPTPSSAESARRQASTSSVTEFKPRLGAARPEDRPDPATIDPTIRLDLLAKVQAVEPEQALRNIFQYGAAPPPPESVKPVELPKNTPKIALNQSPAPTAGAPPVTAPPPTPQAPPMTFKYYGFKVSKRTGRREAFLLDGEDIIIGGENDIVKGGRYRIVRIGPSTITIEDTQFKANQTITLQEEAAV
jgi:hypothetical protein